MSEAFGHAISIVAICVAVVLVVFIRHKHPMGDSPQVRFKEGDLEIVADSDEGLAEAIRAHRGYPRPAEVADPDLVALSKATQGGN